MAKNTKLWGGRFEGTVEDWVERFGASISFDQKLAKFDVIGSLAHVQMLGQTGILSLKESEKIQEGLKELLEEGNYIRLVLEMTKLRQICTYISRNN